MRYFTLGLTLLAAVAFAQSSVLINGTDTSTDGGIIRKVQVDSQGRIVTVAPDGGISVRQATSPWLIAGADGGAVSTRIDAPTYPSDGGVATNSNVVVGTMYPCGASSTQSVYTMDAGSVVVGTLNPRVYVVVCNSKENISGAIRCRADNVAPIIDAGSPGTVLGIGDCVPYSNPVGVPVRCIGAGGLYVTSYECAP